MKLRHTVPVLLFLFLLGIRDGYITLWKIGDPDPVEQFSYQAKYLPPPDRHALEKGISIEDPRELAHLLEDYLS